MICKQRFMALMISASMGLSMLASPVAALAAEEPPAAEETQDTVTEETAPAAMEAEPAPEEKEEEAAPAEEVQEPEEEAPAETVDAGQAGLFAVAVAVPGSAPEPLQLLEVGRHL